MEDHNPVCNGMSDLFIYTIWHATINQSIIEWFSLAYWTPAYNLCLRARCRVMVANLDISGPLTITPSAPESHILNSQVGTLFLGFCQNHCTRSIKSVALYGRAVTCKWVWPGTHWSGGTPASLSCIFPIFWIIIGWISRGSVTSRALRFNLKFLFSWSTRSIDSEVWLLSIEILRMNLSYWKMQNCFFFLLIYSVLVLTFQCSVSEAGFNFLEYWLLFQPGLKHLTVAMSL